MDSLKKHWEEEFHVEQRKARLLEKAVEVHQVYPIEEIHSYCVCVQTL